MQPVRIYFEKRGRARFISHLDLNRCMSRALRRAEIPVWYTQGFNPHPYITFALPLSLFYESGCEIMDMKLDGEMSLEELGRRLNAQMPEGVRITAVAPPSMKPTEIACAAYEVGLDYPGRTAGELQAGVQGLLEQPELMVEKKTKHGQYSLDMLPFWKDAQWTAADGALSIHVLLPAGQQQSVNPSFLSETLTRYAALEPYLDHVLRTALFTEQMQPFQ